MLAKADLKGGEICYRRVHARAARRRWRARGRLRRRCRNRPGRQRQVGHAAPHGGPPSRLAIHHHIATLNLPSSRAFPRRCSAGRRRLWVGHRRGQVWQHTRAPPADGGRQGATAAAAVATQAAPAPARPSLAGDRLRLVPAAPSGSRPIGPSTDRHARSGRRVGCVPVPSDWR